MSEFNDYVGYKRNPTVKKINKDVTVAFFKAKKSDLDNLIVIKHNKNKEPILLYSNTLIHITDSYINTQMNTLPKKSTKKGFKKKRSKK